MGMATSKVRLNICGSSYVVNTSESEDYMQNLADRLNLDMNELMASSNSVSITTAAVMTALNYRDELEKASGSADNMRRQGLPRGCRQRQDGSRGDPPRECLAEAPH